MLKVLEIALAEVGYREGAGNITKYAAELDKLTGFYNGLKNGYAWCDVFVDWCFVRAYGRKLAQQMLCQPDNSAGAGCTYSAQYYQRAGRWSTAPQVGAQIFFGNGAESYHTGLVYDVDDTHVYTVEGNTSDGVYKRQYAIGASNIYGYGLPDYSLAEENGGASGMPRPTQRPAHGKSVGADSISARRFPLAVILSEAKDPVDKATTVDGGTGSPSPTCAATLPVIKYGDTGEAVKAMQTLLIMRGCSCGVYGADGDFGADTAAGLKNFQAGNALEADGICGALTWRKLIGGGG